MTYDLLGNLLTNKAADNVVTSTRTYDVLNRLTSEKDGKNQTINYNYDSLDRMSSYTDAKGATFSFQYDLLGRLTRRIEPDATFQTYTYDVAGRLLVHTKADLATKTNHYENPARDFLTKITYSNGEAPRLMSYDRLGRLLTAANASSTITRSYDAAGRQLSEAQAHSAGPSGTFTYQYDTDGNLKKHIRPDGSFIDYTWNARNLLASVISDAPPPLATYTYNARNQIADTTVENGLFTVARSYDAAGRLTGLSNGTLDATAYTLSPDGRRTTINRNGTAETYGYDNARQVTSANYPDLSTTQSWNFDASGNRQSATTNSVITNYTANSVNEYTSISGGGFQPPSPSYDANTLSLPRPDGTALTLTWNIYNEQITATNAAGDTASYQYDALGRRTKRIETIAGNTTTTHFFTNGWNGDLEHHGSDYTTRLSWGRDLSESLQGAGGVGGLIMVETLPSGSGSPIPYFPTYDGNGNITAWIDSAETVIARQRYDAFGNIIQQIGSAPSSYGFSTKPQEKVTGLLYYGYRYYDPVSGRWPSRDPIEEDGGKNLYNFVNNSSSMLVDLLGMSAAKSTTCEEKICKFPKEVMKGKDFAGELKGATWTTGGGVGFFKAKYTFKIIKADCDDMIPGKNVNIAKECSGKDDNCSCEWEGKRKCRVTILVTAGHSGKVKPPFPGLGEIEWEKGGPPIGESVKDIKIPFNSLGDCVCKKKEKSY